MNLHINQSLGPHYRYGELFLMQVIKKLVFAEWRFSHGTQIQCVIMKISLVVANYFFLVYISFPVYFLTSLIFGLDLHTCLYNVCTSCQDFHDLPLPQDLASPATVGCPKRETHETLDEGLRVRVLLKRHGEMWFESMYWIHVQVRVQRWTSGYHKIGDTLTGCVSIYVSKTTLHRRISNIMV
jgi:hypothetical protein